MEVCTDAEASYNWLTREDGQMMAEYGVVLAVITIAVRRLPCLATS
jgi:hypothetical protein